MPKLGIMDLQSILISRPPKMVVASASEARAVQPSLEENIKNLNCESQVRLVLESEMDEINKKWKEGDYEEARRLRTNLIFSSEAERAAHANKGFKSLTRSDISTRLESVQQTALELTKHLDLQMGIENSIGESFLPLMISREEMNRKSVGELYNRNHDLWYLVGLKQQALVGDKKSYGMLMLAERVCEYLRPIYCSLKVAEPLPQSKAARACKYNRGIAEGDLNVTVGPSGGWESSSDEQEEAGQESSMNTENTGEPEHSGYRRGPSSVTSGAPLIENMADEPCGQSSSSNEVEATQGDGQMEASQNAAEEEENQHWPKLRQWMASLRGTKAE
ncbi:hypothetical protein Dda_3464 [Drechslerella dactyloides]|uniref:Uncharacterized protein n=1 Tax=Drechslerella dactyloides TaxID=74499 RepID=A0AAD6J2K6_DREDA|nr:hypothetical protein Dda_3464 [Drechslerella dactyloides]